MTGENRKARVSAETQKGDEALRAAQILLDTGLYNDAVGRMYYAAFHYATAALASVDVQARSHGALQSLFSLHLVKTGKLAFQQAKDLRRLQGYREAADYDAEFRFDLKGASEELAVARAFVQAARAHLVAEGLLETKSA